jgi:hypothetical protein
MKKLIYIILFALLSNLVITSCTEESITPTNNGGGGVSSDKDSLK